jgi:hypothetical protein
MSWLSPALLLCSLLLLSAGFALLLYRAKDEDDGAEEPSPADLSTSLPARRSCWSGLRARLQGTARRPRSRSRTAMAREIMLEMAEVSAARTLLAGCIADLW